jgi:hypothetical protein
VSASATLEITPPASTVATAIAIFFIIFFLFLVHKATQIKQVAAYHVKPQLSLFS